MKGLLITMLIAAVFTGYTSPADNDDPPAAPPGRMVVSVLRFENRAGPDAEHWKYGLNGCMNAAIMQVKAIRLRTDGIGYAQRELGIEKGAAFTAEQLRNIGEIVEAQRIIWGSYQGSGNSWQVTAFLLNVASGEVSEPIMATGTDWYDLRDKLVQQILEQLKINPSKDEIEKMRRRATHSPQAYEWYAKASAHQSEGSPLPVMEEYVRQAIEADPDFAEAYATLAAIHGNQGAFEEAEINARRALEIKPNFASAHHILGVIHLFKKQNEQALEELQEALRIEPDDVDILGRLSDFYLIEGEWEKAMPYAEEAIALAPLNANLHAQLGWICVKRHDRDRALHELSEAEHLMDLDASADCNTLQRIGQSYSYLGEIPQAIEYYEKLMAQVRKEGASTERYAPFAKTLQRMKASLTPIYVEAEMPRMYTEETLQQALQENLAPAELDMVVNPLAGSPEISRWARQLTAGTTNEIDRAKVIFDALIQRIQLDGGYGTRTAREVFAAWNDPDQVFSCQEFAKLYVALAREVGINSFYVHLGRDYKGKFVFHDCAIVFVDDKALLVDPSYRWFGIPHQEFTVLDDVQTVAHQLFQHTPGERSVARSRVAARLHPDFAWGQMYLASVLVDDDQTEEAIKALEHAECLEPGRWDAYRLRGVIAAKDGDWDTAIAHFNKALELNPEDAKTHHLLGKTLLAQGEKEEAREAYRACLRNGARDREADEARRAIVQINENIGVESGKEFEVAALMVATKEGNIETVLQMLAEGADANARETSGMTPLLIAVLRGHAELVELLLEAGAKVNVADESVGITPLFLAAQEGHNDIVRLLIAADADVNATLKSNGATALHVAAEKGYIDVVRQLLAAHAEVNVSLSDYGTTALYLAAENDRIEVINLLLAANAKVVAACPDQETAVLIASERGHAGVVKLLLTTTADINVMLDEHGAAALFLASQNGHIDVVNQLLAAGADVNAMDINIGAPPLFVAAQNGHADVVKLLLANQADVDAALKQNGYTPLIIAVLKNHADVVQLLLDAGADRNAKGISPEGEAFTPLELAQKLGHEKIVELLLKKGPNGMQGDLSNPKKNAAAMRDEEQLTEPAAKKDKAFEAGAHSTPTPGSTPQTGSFCRIRSCTVSSIFHNHFKGDKQLTVKFRSTI